MALLGTHPDYMCFNGPSGRKSSPQASIRIFLQHVCANFAGQFWHALPQEVAELTALSRPRPPRKAKRICMLAYSHYENDARVKRYEKHSQNGEIAWT